MVTQVLEQPSEDVTRHRLGLRRRSGVMRSRSRWGVLLSLPALLIVLIFVVYPTLQTLYYSFTNWNGLTSTFTGFTNYASTVFTGPGVHRILINNLVFILSVPFAVFLEYCLAYVLWNGVRGGALIRIVLFIPMAASWAAVGLLFRQLLLVYAPNWLSTPGLSLLVVILAFHWTTSGTNVMIIYAGLSTVDRSQIEAATLDGAGQFRIMTRIVAPNAIAFIDFAVIITLIMSMTSIFGLIYTFNFGGPGFSTTTLEFNLYQSGFTVGDFGLAAATGILILVITILISLARVIPTIKRLQS
jgi:multiple sugar transport system permease protein